MLFFLDTETTGIGPEDRLCQLAYKSQDSKININELFLPPVRIKYRAMSVHHITQDMVKSKIQFNQSETKTNLIDIFQNPDNIIIAHNADFDIQILERDGVPPPKNIICTYKVICHLDPEGKLNAYNEQYLRYKLGIEIEGIAHDAWGDILVLEQIFYKLQERINIDKMIEISSNPLLLPRIQFGKHKGTLFKDIPIDYLRWFSKQQDIDENLRYTIEYWLGKQK